MSTSLTKNDGQVVRSEKPTSVELTVYQSGDAVVHESREVDLPKGKVTIQLEGLPQNFVEDSFEVSDVSGPGNFKLGPDSFKPANLSSQALLAKAVGRKITLLEQTSQGQIRTTGTLRFVLGNQLVIEDANGIQVLPLTQKFELESIPDGLSATPSLSLEPTTAEAGVYLLNSMYETGGLAWAPRYAVFYDDKTGTVTKLRCRVKLTNQTGADFDDAQLKLLAAHNTSRGGGRGRGARSAGLESAMQPMAAAASFGGGADYADNAEVGSVGEQKIYVLPEKLTLKNGETKRPYLVVAKDVPVKAEFYLPAAYHYHFGNTDEDAQKLPVFVRLRLRNDAENNLGFALPAGEVAVFQPDSTGKYQKTDPQLHIASVAKGEAFKLELTTPSSDVKATRRLVSFHQDPEEKAPEVEPVPEGGHVFPQHEVASEGGFEGGPRMTMSVQGGPRVGTPGEHARRRQEVAEGSGKKAKPEPKPRFREEQREITLYNFKDKGVQVIVQESLPHGYSFLDKTHELTSDSENSGTFTIDVPANGQVTIGYGIRWKIN